MPDVMKDTWLELLDFGGETLAHVKSEMGYPAYYPLRSARIERPVEAVLMDLDGTSVHSESFWVELIRLTVEELLGKPGFSLEESDIPYVSGHSVSEHLAYCIKKYCPGKTVEEAKKIYYGFTRSRMEDIMEGKGEKDSFLPAPGLKNFLLELKSRKIKIGLVTSGLYEKAWPEILEAFRVMDMGRPEDFYDCIITAGTQPGRGSPGTLGELEAKPHPWLYAEAARVGLGIPFQERHRVIGVEDSMAGIVSIRLAGFFAVGVPGGNIAGSPLEGLVSSHCGDFEEILKLIDEES